MTRICLLASIRSIWLRWSNMVAYISSTVNDLDVEVQVVGMFTSTQSIRSSPSAPWLPSSVDSSDLFTLDSLQAILSSTSPEMPPPPTHDLWINVLDVLVESSDLKACNRVCSVWHSYLQPQLLASIAIDWKKGPHIAQTKRILQLHRTL
jgi:hypothetical protein